jgi:hypothetical protein
MIFATGNVANVFAVQQRLYVYIYISYKSAAFKINFDKGREGEGALHTRSCWHTAPPPRTLIFSLPNISINHTSFLYQMNFFYFLRVFSRLQQ